MAGLNITRLLGIVVSSDIVGRGPDFDGRPQHVGIYLDLFGDLVEQTTVLFRYVIAVLAHLFDGQGLDHIVATVLFDLGIQFIEQPALLGGGASGRVTSRRRRVSCICILV